MATLAILACGLVQSGAEPAGDVATIVAATLHASTTSSPTQASIEPGLAGIAVSFPEGGLVIPEGLAGSASSETIPAVDGQSGGPWEVAPEYVKITLQGYALQGKFFEPQIMIYPAPEYAAASEGAANSIQRLQAILANPSQIPENDLMPSLPYANAAQIIGAQTQVVTFNGGRGLRVLAEYAQDCAQINNHDLFYHFEGLTDDGRSYIVATLPVTAPFLAADSNPASIPPAGGVPFPGYEATDESLFVNYYRSVTDRLNATSPDEFQPTLTSLDALIQSLEVSP
jgi:hypothetical protein